MEYREERLRGYGLGSQCFLHSSCKTTQRLFSETHCSFTAFVRRGDELAARIEQLHGKLGVFPTALQAEAQVLEVQLRLHPPGPAEKSSRSQMELQQHCDPPWRARGLPSSWPQKSGLVASSVVHFSRDKNSSDSIGDRYHGHCDSSRSLLALLVPVTSRHTNTSLGIVSAPLLQILVPSLVRTLYLSNSTAAAKTKPLNYVLMIGFDEGDVLWVGARSYPHHSLCG